MIWFDIGIIVGLVLLLWRLISQERRVDKLQGRIWDLEDIVWGRGELEDRIREGRRAKEGST